MKLMAKICVPLYVPYKDFERHFNLGITPEYISILHEQLLNDLIPYLDDNFIGVTRFYSLRSNNLLFDGVRVMNIMGSSIMLNMYGIDENISSEYNKKYEEYVNNLQSTDKILKSNKKL